MKILYDPGFFSCPNIPIKQESQSSHQLFKEATKQAKQIMNKLPEDFWIWHPPTGLRHVLITELYKEATKQAEIYDIYDIPAHLPKNK